MSIRPSQRWWQEAARRTGLTGQGFAVLGAAVALVVAGVRLHNPGLTVFGIALGLLVLVAWLTGRRRVVLTADRKALPRRVRLGALVSGGFEVTAAKNHASLAFEEEFPDSLATRVRVVTPGLKATEPFVHSYQFQADRRGTYEVGPLYAEVSDAFGLVRRRHEIAPKVELIVHPNSDKVVDRITAREFEDPIIRPPSSTPWPTGAEFYGMRNYVYGDDPRRIVWRAVAAHDSYLVREAEHGIADRVTILLDTDQLGYGKHDPSPTFETAVRAAASVGGSHLANGFAVTVETCAQRLGPPMRGQGERITLLDRLAAVTQESATLQDGLTRLLLDRGGSGHLVVITSRLDSAATGRLRLLQKRGRSLVIGLIVGEHTDPQSFYLARSLRCPVAELVAYEPTTRPFQHALEVAQR